jgi:hypothetical protein
MTRARLLKIGLPFGILVAMVALLVGLLVRANISTPLHFGPTYADYGNQAITNMIADFYTDGRWKACISGCGASNHDWGADSLTYTLALRRNIDHHDPRVVPYLRALAKTTPIYDAPCQIPRGCTEHWSDDPMWDSVAMGKEYTALGQHDAALLANEKAAFAFVDRAGPAVFAFGACPGIHYQQPGGGDNKLKTLETDSNYIKAALLLYRFTHDMTYLDKAKAEYLAVRHYFLDPALPLYSVYVFDDGTACTQVRGRFFASVNGNMIDNGLVLAEFTGDKSYLGDALATAQAVAHTLSDANGVFADLQAENDIEEPLIEAMSDIGVGQNQLFARNWLLTAASASASSLKSDGTYSRMFDGPPNHGTSTAWQSNGGYALAVAAAEIDPSGVPASTTAWVGAIRHPISITTSSLPASITFTGAGIALIGTLGERCCEAGHARVFIDGSETADTTGIWQNKSSAGISIPNTVLFAWRWPTAGPHTITIQPGEFDAKEGGSFVNVSSYLVLPA